MCLISSQLIFSNLFTEIKSSANKIPWTPFIESIFFTSSLLVSSFLVISTMPIFETFFPGKNFSEFKDKLSQIIIDKIGPISNEIKRLLKDKSYLDKILDDGCKKADTIASTKVKKIHDIVGF